MGTTTLRATEGEETGWCRKIYIPEDSSAVETLLPQASVVRVGLRMLVLVATGAPGPGSSF